MTEYDSSVRRMVVGNEIGDFLIERLDTNGKTADYCESLQKRNQKLINALVAMHAPEELIEQAREDEAQGTNAILTVIDEIRMQGEFYVIPEYILNIILEAMGPRATMMLSDLCREYENHTYGPRDIVEPEGRREPSDDEVDRL